MKKTWTQLEIWCRPLIVKSQLWWPIYSTGNSLKTHFPCSALNLRTLLLPSKMLKISAKLLRTLRELLMKSKISILKWTPTKKKSKKLNKSSKQKLEGKKHSPFRKLHLRLIYTWHYLWLIFKTTFLKKFFWNVLQKTKKRSQKSNKRLERREMPISRQSKITIKIIVIGTITSDVLLGENLIESKKYLIRIWILWWKKYAGCFKATTIWCSLISMLSPNLYSMIWSKDSTNRKQLPYLVAM
jgi:hypothetical protein